MLIALFPNAKKQGAKQVGISIYEYLSSRGVEVVAEDSDAECVGAAPLSSVPSEKIDFIIAIGGDGTILRLMQRHPQLNAPVLGINLGSLGFMADAPMSDLYPSLRDLLEGAYGVEERLMLKAIAPNGEFVEAINDVVIHRGSNPSLVDMAVHIDGHYVNTFAADGLIIATPNGSTAYSLSAGGPIITPRVNAFILTPICPHAISNRPLVLLPDNEVEIRYLNDNEPVDVTFDGHSKFSLKSNESVKIERSSKHFKWVSLHRHDYFSTLRTKLGWSGHLKQR